eukprot:6190225-Pleurochrysis_carterae.AAC.2
MRPPPFLSSPPRRRGVHPYHVASILHVTLVTLFEPPCCLILLPRDACNGVDVRACVRGSVPWLHGAADGSARACAWVRQLCVRVGVCA